MGAEECLKKTYVKLRYIPPMHPEEPLSCANVIFTKSPEITFAQGNKDDPLFGIDLVCAVPFTTGAGGVILLLQITSYIKWEVGFLSKKGSYVHETHSVFASVPMMYKLHGPRMALMAISPLKVKLVGYAGMIVNAFKKIDEMEKVLAKVMALKKSGFCPKDIKALEDSLKAFETELNDLLQRASRGSSDGEIARVMQHRGYNSGNFVGTRMA